MASTTVGVVVYPGALFGWEVLVEGFPESECFPSRVAAVEYAQCVADLNRPARIQIEDWYGRVELQWGLSRPVGAAAVKHETDSARPSATL